MAKSNDLLPGDQNKDLMERDPICQMYLLSIVDCLKSEYKGKLYYFCCMGCKSVFDENPEKYISKIKAKDISIR